MLLQGERNRSTARAKIDRTREISLQCEIDEQLGLGTRNEHRRVDRELEPVELLAAEDVRHRLAGLSS
jgi:hypothetical protein